MYNLRYHIASLVGVFLALSLGLILGGLVVQRGAVDRQQGALVDGLRKEFSTLRAENRALTEKNGTLSVFSEDMSRDWVDGQLVGKSVIVVSSAGRSDGARAAVDSVQSAGGTAVSVVLLKPGFGLQDEKVRSLLSSEADTPESAESIATSLVAEWKAVTTERPLTAALQEAGVLDIEGLEPGTPATGLVDLAAQGGRPSADGLALAAAFAAEDGRSVAAEVPLAKAGLAAVAWARKIPAIDTLGTEIGRYSLVALLTGAKPEYYGTGQAASAPYPPPSPE